MQAVADVDDDGFFLATGERECERGEGREGRGCGKSILINFCCCAAQRSACK